MRLARMAAFNRSLTARIGSPLLSGSWRPLGPLGLFDPGAGFFGSGPQLDAGRIGAIAPSVVAGGPLIIGTASGGVWRSSSLSPTWTPLTDAQCSLNTGAVAIDPTNPLIVYAGTGEYNQGTTGCGVLRSIDGGNTWTTNTSGIPLGTTGAVRFASMVVDRASAGSASSTILLAGTNAGVLRSANSGSSWTNPLTGGVFSVIAHPTRAGVYYAGDRDQTAVTHRGVFRSTDALVSHGRSFRRCRSPIRRSSGGSKSRCLPRAGSNLRDRANVSNNRLLGLFRFDQTTEYLDDSHATGVYTGASRGDFGAQASYDLAIAMTRAMRTGSTSPACARFARPTAARRSSRSPTNPLRLAHHRHRSENPDILYAGTDGGVFISTDAGDMDECSAGLTITQYYPGIQDQSRRDRRHRRLAGQRYTFFPAHRIGTDSSAATAATPPSIIATHHHVRWRRSGASPAVRSRAGRETSRARASRESPSATACSSSRR
jgi:hypothetical protein